MVKSSETAETLNSFFPNIVKKLNISRYSDFDSVIKSRTDPTLKAVFKHKGHPSFFCLDHELLIVRLNAYGFSLLVLKLAHDYLSNRKQRTKEN